MQLRSVVAMALSCAIAIPAVVSLSAQPAAAYEVEHYTVYCADERIEISFWDLEQMKVRRGL